MKRLLHVLLGDAGERRAARFLKRLGYRILERQYRNPFGEIDIIALDGRQIVFVEVKTRSNTGAGQPFEAVDRSKQQKIARTALAWLKQQRRLDQPCRFDILSLIWPDGQPDPRISHFKSAFEAPGFGQLCG